MDAQQAGQLLSLSTSSMHALVLLLGKYGSSRSSVHVLMHFFVFLAVFTCSATSCVSTHTAACLAGGPRQCSEFQNNNSDTYIRQFQYSLLQSSDLRGGSRSRWLDFKDLF